MSRRVIKATELVVGGTPIMIVSPWSMAVGEMAASRDTEAACAGEEEDGFGGPAEYEDDPSPEVAAARECAAELIAVAQTEAERLLAEAREEADALREEARQQGYQEGYRAGEARGAEEGRDRAEAELEGAVKEAMKVLTAAVHERTSIVAGSKDDVLKVVRRVAEKIIRTEVRLDPEVTERAVEAGLRLVAERSQVLVRVHPDDLERARAGIPGFLRYFTPSTVLEVCGDPRVAPGGCLIETNAGNIDAQLETQLEEVMGQLGERLNGG